MYQINTNWASPRNQIIVLLLHSRGYFWYRWRFSCPFPSVSVSMVLCSFLFAQLKNCVLRKRSASELPQKCHASQSQTPQTNDSKPKSKGTPITTSTSHNPRGITSLILVEFAMPTMGFQSEVQLIAAITIFASSASSNGPSMNLDALFVVRDSPPFAGRLSPASSLPHASLKSLFVTRSGSLNSVTLS